MTTLNREFLVNKYELDILEELREVRVWNSSLTAIDANAFSGLNKLERLYLDYNQITSIDESCFNSLTNLKSLNLENNKLKRIDSKALRNLINLEKLKLQNNEIEEIEFENLSKLELLWLNGNEITKIGSAQFKGLYRLEELSLSDNNIEEIDVKLAECFPNLRELYLGGNKLKWINSGTFSGLVKLEKLGLDGNEIEGINTDSFENLPSLKVLWLYGNKLKREIDRKCFEPLVASIEFVRLYENDFKFISYYNPANKLLNSFYNADKLNENGYTSEWDTFLKQFEKEEPKRAICHNEEMSLLPKEALKAEPLKKDHCVINPETIEHSKDKFESSHSSDSFDRYKQIKVIGYGSYGVVYLVKDLNINQYKAMKAIKKVDESWQNEFESLWKISHENIVKYFDHFDHTIEFTEYTFIITEYCENGDLEKKINQKRVERKSFSEKEIFNLISQATNALKYLHSDLIQIVHRDIKPGNILLTKDNVVKLADLGMAKVLCCGTIGRTYVGTKSYMSPELDRCELDEENTYSFKTDVWSLGCVLYELIYLKLAFPKTRAKTDIPSFSDSGRFAEILTKMIEVNPDIRIDSKRLYALVNRTFDDDL